jgi:hypothetical protein
MARDLKISRYSSRARERARPIRISQLSLAHKLRQGKPFASALLFVVYLYTLLSKLTLKSSSEGT